MDVLSYEYYLNTNRLKNVNDSGNESYGFKELANTSIEYTYDANGNMIKDDNKGITNITYNHLNLPVNVTLAGGTITYTYDATGNKLRKVANGTTTDYAGNFIYENGVLQFFNHAEGYVKNDAGTFNYVYQYKDHLGNVRLSYTDNNNDGIITPNTEIIEESNYYPFGLKQIGYNGATSSIGNDLAQKWGYNGKEYQDDNINGTNLNWYDFGARNYDAALGRWMNLDPLAEKYMSNSPFIYTLNNPVIYTDPDGMRVEWGEGLSSKEKQLLGYLITQLRRNSKSFDKVFNDLHGSKSVYTIGGKGSPGDDMSANFEPNSGDIKSEDYDEDTGELISGGFEETNNPGGKINLAASFILNETNGGKEAQNFLIGQIAEEFSHAYQWESMNPYNRTDDNNSFGLDFEMRSTLDYEFEAKALSGIIFNESKTPLSDLDKSDRMAADFGIKYGKQGLDLKKYYRDMKSWKNNSSLPSSYSTKIIGNKAPTILLKLIK